MRWICYDLDYVGGDFGIPVLTSCYVVPLVGLYVYADLGEVGWVCAGRDGFVFPLLG